MGRCPGIVAPHRGVAVHHHPVVAPAPGQKGHATRVLRMDLHTLAPLFASR